MPYHPLLPLKSHENIYLSTAGKPWLRPSNAARQNPPAEDTTLSVGEIISGGPLYLFDSRLIPSRYPSDVTPTYSGIIFPVPPLDISWGNISFTIPALATGRWAFAVTLIRLDNGQCPADPPVVISNAFNIL